MLKIWGRANSSNVAKVMWAVAELENPHEHVDSGGPFAIVMLDTAMAERSFIVGDQVTMGAIGHR